MFLKDTSKCLFKTRIIFYFWYTFEVRIILLWMSLYPLFYIHKEILFPNCLLINEILIAVRINLWWWETLISRKFEFLKNFFLFVKKRLLHVGLVDQKHAGASIRLSKSKQLTIVSRFLISIAWSKSLKNIISSNWKLNLEVYWLFLIMIKGFI